MARTVTDTLQQLPAARRRKVQARAAELVAEEMSLRDLRKAMNRTQAELANVLKVGQDTVSRYEQRSDMLLSTLQGHVQAMGGELDLVVTISNRKPVKLKSSGDVAG
jgi:DNA-binding XRE family transcriptional regulator